MLHIAGVALGRGGDAGNPQHGRLRQAPADRPAAGRSSSLIIASYAGWGPGQLEVEFAEETWRSLPARPEHVFWTGDDDLWEAVTSEIGRADIATLLKIREMPDDPSMN